MDWVWELFKPYILREMRRLGDENPGNEVLQQKFIEILSVSTVSVLVQEPWQNSVRFKGLAKYDASSMMPLINNPMEYLFENFGGGKFKLNFHHGLNFVSTRNFKPEGQPKWVDMEDIGY